MTGRRAFLAQLFAAPIIALAVLRTPLRFEPVAGWPASEEPLGLSMRFVESYDISTLTLPTRMDVIYGAAEIIPEWACRVTEQRPWWSLRRWIA